MLDYTTCHFLDNEIQLKTTFLD